MAYAGRCFCLMSSAPALALRFANYQSTSAGDWLQHMLGLIATQARRDVACIPSRPEAAIHSLRKRMKKIRSLLLLAAPGLDEATHEIVKGGIREIKDAAMSRRDADVMEGLAEDLGVRLPAWKIIQPDVAMLDAYVSELVTTFEELDLHGLTWNGVAVCHLRTCRRTREAWQKARRHPSEKKLHTWRKRVKQQYHQSLALYRWLGQSGRLRRMRRLGSLLGRRHDLDVFASILPDQSGKDRKARHKVGSRRKKLTRRIFNRAEKLYSRPLSKSKRRLSARLTPQSTPLRG